MGGMDRFYQRKKENKTPTTSGGGMNQFYQRKRYNSTDTSAVNDAYIDAFYNDWKNFASSAEKDYGGLGWGNASSSYESRNATWKDLSARADVLEAYYYKNRNNFKDADGYASTMGGLNDIRSGASDILKAFQAEADYYSNFATEDEFNEWNKYSHIPEASDFAEKSKYKSTYRGGEMYNAFSNMYTDTGFDDIMYDYINRDENARQIKSVNDISNNSSFLGFDNRERREMTDDEISIFNYIYSTQGKDAAYEYVDHITAGPVGLNARQRAKETEMWGNYAKESPVASSVFSVLEAPLKGLSYIGQTADYFSDGKIDQNAGYNKFSYINSAIRDQVTQDVEKNWGGVGSFAYQTGMSMADFLFTTAISGGNSALSLGIMGTGAAADTVIYAKDRGLSDTQAFALGTIAGAAEIVTEKISLDALLDATQLGKNALGYIAQNIIAEGTEEVTSSAINLIADVLISRDKSEWREAINAYKAVGMSDNEAFWHAVGDQALSLGLDFLGGAISGGVMGGGGATLGAINTAVNTADQGSEFKGFGADLTREALEINPENRYAQKMQGKLDSGKTLSNYQLGKLVQQNETEMYAQDKAKMKAAIEQRLTELGESGDISALADVIVKARTDGNLTRSERNLLTNSKYGRRVSTEMNPDIIESGDYSSAWAEGIGTDRINAEAYGRMLAQMDEETAPQAEAPTAPQAEAAPVTENAPIKENAAEGEIKAPADVKQAVVSEAKQTETATMLDGEGNEVSVNPVKFAEIGDGEATLELEGGQTVKADSVEFKNSGVGFVYQAATEMASGGVGGFNVDAANVMVRGVSPDISEEDASLYVAAFNEAYRYGAMGYPTSALETRWSTAYLTEDQRTTAYSLGKIYGEGKVAAKQANIDRAKAESAGKPRKKGKVIFDGSAVGKTLTEMQRASLKGLRVVAEAMGVDIHVFESPVGKNGKREGANGLYDPVTKELHLDLHAGIDGNGLMLMTGSHELTHHIKNVAPAKFKVYADAVLEEYTKNGISADKLVARKLEFLEKKGRLEGKTEEQAYELALEEVVADASEAMLVDSGAIETLSKRIKGEDKGLWEIIKDFIAKLVARIRAAYAGVDPDSVEGKLMRKMKDSAERLQKLWVEALVDAADTMTATEQFSTETLRGSADGAVIQSKVTEALTEIAEGEGVLYSLRTEFEAMPKQVMNLSSGEGTIIEHIEGLTPTEVKGLASVSTNGFTGRDVRGYAMRNGGFSKAQINHVNAFMDAMADLMEKAGVTYKFIGLQDVENAKLHYSYNPDGSIKSIVLSAMVKNGDYPVNFDLSSICKKRVAMSTLIDKLAKRGSLDNGTVKLTPANIFRINTALKDAGYETACLGCFVESKRYNSLQWAKTFCDKWNAAVKKVNPNATYFGYGDNTFSEDSFTVEQAIKIDNAATRYNTSTKTERLANAIAKYKERAQAGLPLVEGKVMKIDGEELNTFSKAARDRLINSDLISDELKDKYLNCDVSTLTLEDVEVLLETGILSGARLSNKQSVTEMVKSGEVYQHLLKPSDLLTDRGISKLEALPNFHGVLYGHYGSGTPKLMQGYTPYNSEIALLPGGKGVGKNEQSLAEYLYTIAGVRMQSFSDFQIQNIYDYLQMVADLAARKVPAHAYTKEISFAKLLGMTGIKVNLSVMFDIDPMVDKAHAGLTKYNMLVHKGEYAKIVLEDAQGKWVYNIGDYQTQKMFDTAYPDESKRFLQSIGFSDAVKLQTSPGYSANCGIIGVGYSDLGIFAMLDDKRVRYIIPYHASSLPAEIKVATHIELGTDYTPYQNNMKIVGIVDRNGNKVEWTIKEAYKRLGSGQAVINELNGKVRNEGWEVTTKKAQTGHGTYGLYEDLKATGDPKQTANNFMDWCIGNGTLPLFYQFASHENYYKMLYDYNVYDCVTDEYAPQQAVTNTYPTTVDGKVQPGTVTDGGFDTAYLKGTIDKQMSFMDEYGKNLDKDLEKLSDNMEKGKYSLHEWRFSDRDSEGGKLSEEQMGFFKDSAIRDEDGSLQVVYHGTTSEFNTFERGDIGYHFGSEAQANNRVSDQNGEKRFIKAYLNIKNPLVVEHDSGSWHGNFAAGTMLAWGDFSDNAEAMTKLQEIARIYDEKTADNEMRKFLKSLGYDGVKYLNTHESERGKESYSYIAFESNQIKSAENQAPTSDPDIRYSDRGSYAPVFYSHMGKVIDDVKLEKMGSTSILNHLKNRGVKAEEIKWSGIETFLEGKRSVTKAELQEFVAGSQLRIEEESWKGGPNITLEPSLFGGDEWEVMLGGEVLDTYSWSDEYELYISDNTGGGFKTKERLLEYFKEKYGPGNTRWSRYKLSGGENYRELVFKMPNATHTNPAMRMHWGQDAEGILVHARIQDFTVNGKKMLFVEEIQSDWHNEGAKDGYLEKDDTARIEKLKAKAEEAFFSVEDYSTEMTGNAGEWDTIKKTEKGAQLLSAYREAQGAYDNAMNVFVQKVPDAPFRTNYHEYVMKRLLRMAAEEGYDSIGWTPADIQSKRWSEEYAEAYRIEYDQEIPKFMRKYGKKWGATVGRSSIEGTAVWSMDLTDSMKDSVLYEGQTLYSDREIQPITEAETKELEQHFGTTGSFKVAGYLLTDGKLLDFSGKHWGDTTSRMRQVDHRDVGEVLNRGNNGVSDMVDMIGSGNIRLMPETGGINLAVYPNEKQRRVLSTYINYMLATEGQVIIDYDSVGGDTVYSKEYGKYASSRQILSDIRNYFNGARQSDLMQFHTMYSDRQTDSFSNRSLLAGALETAVQNDKDRTLLENYKSNLQKINERQANLNDVMKKIEEIQYKKSLSISGEKMSVSEFKNRAKAKAKAKGINEKDVKFKLDHANAKYSASAAGFGTILEADKTFRSDEEKENLQKLYQEAKEISADISTFDKELLRLEAMDPIKRVLNREKALAYKKAEQRGKEALEAQREREAKTRRELMDRYQASRQRAAEGRYKTAVRLKIKNVVKSLNSYLLSGTKEKHVPIGLQSAVAEALDAVNMDTVGAEKRIAQKRAEMMKAKTPEEIEQLVKEIERLEEMGGNMAAKLERLKTAYDDIINSDDPIIANSYDEVISNTISNVINEVKDTSLRDMSLHQLEAVYDMYKMILATVRNANKAFKAHKSEEISTIANRVIAELDGQKKKNKLQSKAGEVISSFDWNNQKPGYAFERIGSDTFTDVFGSVREGEDVWARDMSEAKAFLEEQKDKYHFKSWDFDKRIPFASTTGKDFSLTLGQIMSLYAYSKRGPQAKEHLKYGGFVFDGITEVKEKTKLGTTKTLKLKDSTPYKLSEGILENIISKLTEEQKGFADAMQDYLSTVMGEKGNEVSLELYDVKLFKEKHYFPLKSAPQFLERAREQATGDVKIKNKGFTKETTPNAKNPIVLTSFMDVWAGHVNEMSMYHAFALPLEDFYRVYHYKSPASETLDLDGVISYLENVHGNASVAYIDQLLKDLNGGARSDPRETFAKALTSKFKKAAVMASLSVVVQQPSAIVRAYALIDARHFVGKKVSKAKQKETWAEVKKYAPVAIIKEMGYFDTGMGQSSADWLKGEKTFMDKVDDVLSFLPSKADELTWCAIWNAVKRETAAKNTDLATSSEEFLKLAGERFTEVITKTQVYDSTLAKSANMRSKSGYMNMLTAFMAEATTSINMLQDAFRKGGKKRIARAMGAVYGSVLLNSVLVSLVYAARDDDEDETYLEKYLSRLVTEVVDGVNPLTYLPFVKDIWSIAQGFDVERADMTLIDSLIDSFKQLFTVCSKDTDDMDEEELGDHRESVREAILSVVDNGASLLGIPEKNLRREIGGAINFIKTLANESGKMSAGSLGDNIVEDLKDSVPVWGWFPDKSKSDKLYDAIVKGDEKYVDRLKSGYKDQNAVNSAIRKALRENDPRIKEAAEARYNGDIAEYMKIAKSIIAEGNFKQDDVVAAINSAMSAMNKSEESSEASDKVVSLYKVDDYFKAIMGGDSASAYAVKYDLIETSIANGKDRDEAEASFNSSLTSHIREKYETGDITEYEAKNMLSYAGKTAEEADSKIQYWSFRKQYPDYDLTESQVSKYYSDVKPSGISVGVYYDYSKQRAKAQGSDLNGDGKTDSGSVKREVLQIIHSLPISSYQKDALYYLNGWSASTIHEAPWH